MTDAGFGIDHLPYGAVVDAQGRQFAAVRFGDDVLDLSQLDAELFAGGGLDRFLAGGHPVWREVRGAVTDALRAERFPLVPLHSVRPVLAFEVADYVDFYASEHHAANAGRIFRPDSPALPPSWRHQPIGYYGRASALCVSGTDIRRPSGQVRVDDTVRYVPSERLDFEAELAFVVGAPSTPGEPVRTADADEHVFGVCLLNDWSARDIQRFETVPLGPFLGKSFATSIAAWITPLDALAGARVASPQDPAPLPHLQDSATPHGLDLHLEVRLNGEVVSTPGFADMYWTYAQMLAHLTSNGSSVRTGDVFASGTVSGPDPAQRGCLLELTWNGTQPLVLGDGSQREWLHDGDVVAISAHSGSIALGEVTGRIRAAR
ncbi:MAG TPA: fumarylacetoacetate hydrolase family protein [Jatrophihabitans sp.]|nr:fumarylacetoacetate hydrolase family protein [Jatrophihabitans sp.]